MTDPTPAVAEFTAARLDAALAAYDEVIVAQGVARLPELDDWYHNVLPDAIASREPMYATLDELARATEWKMARGVWRARNLVLVRANDPAAVREATAAAFATIPDARGPIARIAELGGVGPATASAVAAAAAPETYPFFDEIVAARFPELGPVKWTLSYYLKYAAALRTHAERLGGDWTPAGVERAVWALAGGKAGAALR